MFGSAVLDLGIGMALLFLFMSLICTAAREGAEAFLKSRAKDLERGIREILQERKGDDIVQSFYEHPLIFSLFSGDYDWKKLKGEERSATSLGEIGRTCLRTSRPSTSPAPCST